MILNLIFVASALTSFSAPLNAQAAIPKMSSSSELFSKGIETFAVKDEAGQTPEVKLLDNGGAEESLASLANAAMQWPNEGYVDVKIQSLILEPKNKTSDTLYLSAKLSGKEMEIDPIISRKKFLAGEWIEIHLPKTSKELGILSFNASGDFKFRLNLETKNLEIQSAKGQVHYETQLGTEGNKKVSFSGKGIRQI